MLQVEVSASVRSESGKGPMRRLRMEGKTPAVVYGAGRENVALTFETQTLFQKLLSISRKNAVISLRVGEDDVKNVILKEVQTHPVRDTLLHVDFFEIDLDKERQFSVPLVFEGTAKGCDLGGVLNRHIDSVLLKGLPLDIPDDFRIDVRDLDIGEKISVSVLDVPKRTELVTGKNAVCVVVDKPSGKEELEEGEEVAGESADDEAASTPEE